jgi:multidrug efflux system outer membrane protein
MAMDDLKTSLGLSQQSEISLSDTLEALTAPNAPDISLSTAISDADILRSDVAAAELSVKAATDAVAAARSGYNPQIYGVAMADGMNGVNGSRVGYTVGLMASLPLADGGQRNSEMEQAKARQERATADAQVVRLGVEHDVAQAWYQYSTASAEISASGSGLIAAQKAYDLAILRYNAGKSLSADRLDALATLTKAQATRAEAEEAQIVARSGLAAAIGTTDIAHLRTAETPAVSK